jgi:hypothetical protein
MTSHRRSVALVAALLIAACQPPPVVIPPDAQVVHVSMTDDSVRIEPESVRAGDVYFVMEGPGTGFSLVSRLPSPDAEPTGMTPAQIDAVAGGDFQSTRMEGYAITCAPDAWTEERHWDGCGENVKTTLTPGLYAILGPQGEPISGASVMAVLEVEP